MNLFEAMKLFVRVAELGSFSAVAEQLGVGRSVVSRQIAALEKHLRVKLIHRTTRRLSLTTEGRLYLENSHQILSLVEAANSELLAKDAVPRGVIKMSLPLSFGLLKVQGWLMEFMRLYPEVELRLHFSDSRLNLIEEGLDLSVRVTNTLEETTIVRKLGHCHMLAVAAPEYLQRWGEPNHPEALTEHSCLGYFLSGESEPWRFQVDGQLKRFYLDYRLQANNGDALAEAAAEGMGLAMVPDFIAESYLASGRLVPILEDFAPEASGIYGVLPSNRYMPHRVGVLLDFLADKLDYTRY